MKKTTLLIVSVLLVLSSCSSNDNSKEALLKKIKKEFPSAKVSMDSSSSNIQKEYRVADEFEIIPRIKFNTGTDMETNIKLEKLISKHFGFSPKIVGILGDEIWTKPDYGVVKLIDGNGVLVVMICSKMRAESYLN